MPNADGFSWLYDIEEPWKNFQVIKNGKLINVGCAIPSVGLERGRAVEYDLPSSIWQYYPVASGRVAFYFELSPAKDSSVSSKDVLSLFYYLDEFDKRQVAYTMYKIRDNEIVNSFKRPKQGELNMPVMIGRSKAYEGDIGARHSFVMPHYDTQISRRHLIVIPGNSNLLVKDCGSTCGSRYLPELELK